MGTAAVGRAAVAGMLAMLVPAAPATAAAGSVCDRFAEGAPVGRIQDLGIDEVSGIVAGRSYPGVLWAHNDSGGEPEIYALSPSGQTLGVLPVPGAENVDWEAIGTGPGPRPGVPYLYIGDIGANFRDRDTVTVYRFPEPAPGVAVTEVDTIRLDYPGGVVDAEALFVDPRSGDLFILTKERGFSRVLRAAANELRPGPVIPMDEVARFAVGPDYDLDPGSGLPPSPLPGSLVTAADIAPDGSTVLVRTYHHVLAFERTGKRPVASAFTEPPCAAPQADEPQGETVAFSADGAAYLTVSEGVAAPLHRFAVSPPLNGGR